jgi:hypothetical protein
VAEEITRADVERTHQVLVEQEQWFLAIREAAQARWETGMFATWLDRIEWVASLPKLPPDPAEQAVWVQNEYRLTRGRIVNGPLRATKRPYRRKKPPVIPPDRQLEIAIAAAEARERNQAAEAAESKGRQVA